MSARVQELAKRAAEELLWARVAVQRVVEKRVVEKRSGRARAKPSPVEPCGVLRTRAEWEAACRELRRLRLPVHHDHPKNWDALAALSLILERVGPDGAVLDAGCARYSTLLPSLRLYGFEDLWGNNLEWSRETRHGPVRMIPGDVSATDFAAERFDAVACLSVIEHGVPLAAFCAEAVRLLRPGGLLVISTDYDEHPPDTTGKTAYGQPVHIFSPAEVREFVATAEGAGLRLLGELQLHHDEHVVHWPRVDLDYTFLRLAFQKA